MDAITSAAHRSRILHLADRCGNRDIGCELSAIGALADHRAAFWSTGHQRNDPLWAQVCMANDRGGIVEAWEAIEAEQHDQIHCERKLSFLDTILPLNDKAIASLAKAYAALGSFRDRDELAHRTDRAEGFARPEAMTVSAVVGAVNLRDARAA